jgi:hypothetical protein
MMLSVHGSVQHDVRDAAPVIAARAVPVLDDALEPRWVGFIDQTFEEICLLRRERP